MIKYYKFSLFIVKSNLSKKQRKKLGWAKYTGILLLNKLHKETESLPMYCPESYNKLGFLVYMMTDLFAGIMIDGNGNLISEDFDQTERISAISDAYKEYLNYSTCGRENIKNLYYSYTKGDVVRHFIIDININNEGFEPVKGKDGVPFMKYNFTSNKNIVPKLRNKRANNIIKAYNLQYKW